MDNAQTVDIICAEGATKLSAIKKDVQNLFYSVFEKPLTDNAWEHFYLNAPPGSSTSFVCYIGSDLVAHGGLIPQRLMSKDGKAHDYYLQTAIIVNKEYRNLRIFKELMDAIHRYVTDKGTFVLAFPNKNTYSAFIKMLQWRKIREYNIRQYTLADDTTPSGEDSRDVKVNYGYFLSLDEAFLKWRGELNHLKVYEKEQYKIVYKDYKGALELLDAQGRDLNCKEIMAFLGYDRINIAECFLPLGSLEGLSYRQNVGIPQRMCVYPANYTVLDYESIRPSLLLSDVF